MRTDTIESARTEKEANLKPESPPKAERDIEWIEHSLPYRLVTSQSDGFGVVLGSIVPGQSFGAGPSYRRTGLWGGKLGFAVQARRSANESYPGRFDVSLSHVLGDHTFLNFTTLHRDISEMPYYGAGPDSRKTGRSDYRLEDTNVEVRPGVWVYKGLRASGGRPCGIRLARPPRVRRCLSRPGHGVLTTWRLTNRGGRNRPLARQWRPRRRS